ncbi:MAG: NADH-quinone oxidoreductase subunit L [Gemmatimonadetes bacterium]|nr:NADH-quinone oxidoreductase subunit L [Gemmatimonadota bacterium]NIP77722.1 NADH-quinone oxidoreductase subunit L [Gemmatimonadota bacterium]NIR76941.1 NADH-quinone oxidoreductase subunit L [Gemmatimonadota bacterium]NIU29285.1 NADH-quinone oxidoreductase subunit L [Gemmatimonadota bacterium]NIU34362.1 NADH-quinone oxidoreductase subunit L [Gemmatimonadota bacterium]
MAELVTLCAVLAAPLQEAGAGGEAARAAFEPFFPGLLLLLPLLGFALNGLLALVDARRGAAATRSGGEHDPVGGEARPLTHTLPTWIGPGVVGLAFGVAVVNVIRMSGVELHEPVLRSYWTWIATDTFWVDAALQLDQLSAIMMMVVTGVGFLIHVFSVGYMRDDPGYPRYFAYLNLFVFFMLVLVLGASFPVMFVGWEGVGLCSYLLIGFWFTDREKADAGKKAFIVNRIGDFGFLVAMFLLFAAFGTLDFVSVFERAPEVMEYGGPLATAVGLFLLLGAAGKSAQIPLYTWLPDAMAGPTPVSALIHAATMVTAGVYLVARASVIYALAPTAGLAVAGIGVVTAFFAATIGLAQYDIKRVLAYSTISQLGYMFLGVGVGAYAAGIFHLVTHAFFKALLFLGSGAVIHAMHHALHHTHKDWDAQDMRNMGGLRKHLPVTWVTMWVATLAIGGIWPFAGFFSKDEIIWYAGAAAGGPFAGWYTVFWILALAAAILTAFYMTRLMVMTFHGRNRTGEEEAGHLHEAPAVMTVPLITLAVLSVVGGWINVPETIGRSVLGGFGALPMSEWLHEWLHPVVEAADEIRVANAGEFAHHAPFGGGEFAWALVSTVVAVVVVVVTWKVVAGWRIRPAPEAVEPSSGLRRLLYRKWYVDELYDRLVVQPVIRLSRFCWRVIDQGIIDGLVDASGNLARAVGWVTSLFQTGQVNTYAFVFTLAVLVLIGVTVF